MQVQMYRTPALKVLKSIKRQWLQNRLWIFVFETLIVPYVT